MAVQAADNWGKCGLPAAQIGAQTSLEAQMAGETPSQTHQIPIKSAAALLNDAISGIISLEQDGTAALRLPLNLEMHISIRYNREPAALEPQKRGNSLLMSSSLDYHLLPNLKVGLNSYLYRPDPMDKLALRVCGDQVMGLGPGIKYDLGRWSFLMKSQVQTGDQRGRDLQNTVRIWYAF